MPEIRIILVYHTDLLTHAGVIPEYGDLDSLKTSLRSGWCNTDQSGVSYLGSQRADANVILITNCWALEAVLSAL